MIKNRGVLSGNTADWAFFLSTERWPHVVVARAMELAARGVQVPQQTYMRSGYVAPPEEGGYKSPTVEMLWSNDAVAIIYSSGLMQLSHPTLADGKVQTIAEPASAIAPTATHYLPMHPGAEVEPSMPEESTEEVP